MKMSPKTFAELSFELSTIAFERYGLYLADVGTTECAYEIFYEVMFQRHNDDSHPAFKAGHKRILPFTGSGKWLNNLYVTESLDDTHIRTALKRIFPNANWK